MNASDVTITTAEFYGQRTLTLDNAEYEDLVDLSHLVGALLAEREAEAALLT